MKTIWIAGSCLAASIMGIVIQGVTGSLEAGMVVGLTVYANLILIGSVQSSTWIGWRLIDWQEVLPLPGWFALPLWIIEIAVPLLVAYALFGRGLPQVPTLAVIAALSICYGVALWSGSTKAREASMALYHTRHISEHTCPKGYVWSFLADTCYDPTWFAIRRVCKRCSECGTPARLKPARAGNGADVWQCDECHEDRASTLPASPIPNFTLLPGLDIERVGIACACCGDTANLGYVYKDGAQQGGNWYCRGCAEHLGA